VDWIVVAAPKAKTRKSVSFFLFSTGFSGKYKEENPRKKLKTKQQQKQNLKQKQTNKMLGPDQTDSKLPFSSVQHSLIRQVKRVWAPC